MAALIKSMDIGRYDCSSIIHPGKSDACSIVVNITQRISHHHSRDLHASLQRLVHGFGLIAAFVKVINVITYVAPGHEEKEEEEEDCDYDDPYANDECGDNHSDNDNGSEGGCDKK
jgi:hypothetical protein